jgi:hypothetical protein
MLETSDKKRFFTLIGNSRQLKYFCRVLGTKMFLVKAEIAKSQIMTVHKIVASICDKNYKSPKVKYKITEKKSK